MPFDQSANIIPKNYIFLCLSYRVAVYTVQETYRFVVDKNGIAFSIILCR